MPCYPVFHGKYFVSKWTGQPLTEIREAEIYFCLEQRLVIIREQIIELTVKEFEIFALLIMNPKRVFTYEMITELVWNEEYGSYSRKAVSNHVSNLRQKLKISPDVQDYIKSVYGVGYKFDLD
nr:response regulator transcription factor [Massilioclostridium coli]